MKILGTLLALLVTTPAVAGEFGDCSDAIETVWLDNGRSMRLLSDYTYIDPRGKAWNAPAGSIIDGASIPQILWSLTKGAYEGKYRDASVPHDTECVSKQEEWREVHRMFHDAMRCGEVPSTLAKIMYAAVYHCGPRWGDDQGIRLFPCHEDFVKQLARRIRRYLAKNPEVSLAELAELDDERLVGISGQSIADVTEGLPPGIEVEETLEGFVLRIADFASEEVAVSAGAAEFLDRVRPFIQEYATALIVEGHADSTGSTEFNIIIAQLRADAVRDEIISSGIDPEAVRTVAYGENRPLAEETSSADRERNRRVEILMHEID